MKLNIITPRLILSPISSLDLPSIEEARKESWEELKEFYIWGHDDLSAFCKKKEEAFKLGQDLTFLVFDRERKKMLGNASLSSCNHIDKTSSLGYWIRSSETGKGFASEAATALLYYAEKELKHKKIYSDLARANVGSGAVLKKLGFIKDSVESPPEWYSIYAGKEADKINYILDNFKRVPKLNVSWKRKSPRNKSFSL